ncbi:winged helix-turn-helix domain-containing protein [bacterium]|nr:winged helix-turn-helix domain-containing protein [bacterium]
MSGMVLIVEDEADLAATLEFNLKREGFNPATAKTGAEARTRLAGDRLPELILLDLMLPDASGTELCRLVRADARTRDIPVIMLTARGDEIDRVVGFEVGADDYVVKPFSVRELMLRIKAVLRRRAGQPASEDEPLVFGVLRIDEQSHRVWVADEEVVLTALEFRLLTTFVMRRGRVQTRERLLDDVWGIQADVTTRTVDTHVKRLRHKLGAAEDYIETLRGVGYRFRDKVPGA